MSASRRLDIGHREPLNDTLLTDANLTVGELGALVTAMREAMIASFRVGPYWLYREMRALYLEARQLFMRKYLVR